ncbi:MAG: hypothetical protein KKF33_20470, partial [Alphaproteobacteria bacterium]|nr:hypothetical protein [Alphaproteobacteria bacterium]
MENTSAGGNETGQGAGLSGADLVFTQAGNLAGATGTPPKRVFDGGDDYGTVTAAMLDTILNNVGDAWTLVWKVNAATTGYRFLMAIAQDAGAAADYYLTVGKDNSATDKMRVTVKDALGEEALNTVAATPTTGDVYFAVWAVGGGQPLRFGWCITKPTKWSDFGANNRVICASVA